MWLYLDTYLYLTIYLNKINYQYKLHLNNFFHYKFSYHQYKLEIDHLNQNKFFLIFLLSLINHRLSNNIHIVNLCLFRLLFLKIILEYNKQNFCRNSFSQQKQNLNKYVFFHKFISLFHLDSFCFLYLLKTLIQFSKNIYLHI